MGENNAKPESIVQIAQKISWSLGLLYTNGLER